MSGCLVSIHMSDWMSKGCPDWYADIHTLVRTDILASAGCLDAQQVSRWLSEDQT